MYKFNISPSLLPDCLFINPETTLKNFCKVNNPFTAFNIRIDSQFLHSDSFFNNDIQIFSYLILYAFDIPCFEKFFCPLGKACNGNAGILKVVQNIIKFLNPESLHDFFPQKAQKFNLMFGKFLPPICCITNKKIINLIPGFKRNQQYRIDIMLR